VLDELFLAAYPLARRAVGVRSQSTLHALSAIAFDREDLEQEVVTALWRRLGLFDPGRASLPTFVERVVATKTTTLVRRGMARKRIGSNSETRDIGSTQIKVTVELRVDVGRALGMLSCADREVARLLVQYKPAEIARKLRWSRGKVCRSLDRIRRKFQALGLGRI
jgi:RNA polymerase sigma factor (sigma-70 family)